LKDVFLLSNGLLACTTRSERVLHDIKTQKNKVTSKGYLIIFSDTQLISLPNGLLLSRLDLRHSSTPKIRTWDTNKVKYHEPELAGNDVFRDLLHFQKLMGILLGETASGMPQVSSLY
jgi:hypothetical protein